jgi:hypothetical protein
MRGRRLAIRILGVAATVKGFACALTEGPGCLVDVSTARERQEKRVLARLESAIAQGRPLFVAYGATKSRRGTREAALDEAVTAVCEKTNVMVLRITATQLCELTGKKIAATVDIAEEVARRFPEVAHRLPSKRALWESEDDRFGIFKAAAAALAAWQMFRVPGPAEPSDRSTNDS